MNRKLQHALKKYFGYDTFRIGQFEIISDVLQKKDVLGILPTGSGKSICFQLPSMMTGGLSVVITPLISLMIDQVRETKAFYFKEVTLLHSMQTIDERRKILNNLHTYKVLYISPELIQQTYIIEKLKKINVSLFVIDEAHCISQWGHDFRPDYLRLKDVIALLNHPPTLALTGTATKEVIDDIKKQLDLEHMVVHQFPTERKNIGLVVEYVAPNHKLNVLIDYLEKFQHPTIIYFTSRKTAEDVADFLSKQLHNIKIAYYHGGMDAEERLKVQQQFYYDQIDIICATSAFGMGINKKNIRLVIHYHIPTQIESFIQEIGRAGRDGKQSLSVLLYEKGDEFLPLQIIENELPTEKEIRFIFQILYNWYKYKRTIPTNSEENEQLFQLESNKLNLIFYHLQLHGILHNEQITYDQIKWERAFYEIKQFCNKRTIEKKKKFERMLQYVETDKCLRRQLYEIFDEKTVTKSENCCSHCGILFKQFENKKKIQREDETIHWKKELAYLLQIGDNNERKE